MTSAAPGPLRAAAPPLAFGLACLVAAFLAPSFVADTRVGKWLVDARFAECAPRAGGAATSARATLERERWRLAANARAAAGALGIGCLLVGLLRLRRSDSRFVGNAAAGPLLGAALAAGYTLVGQVRLAVDGYRDGLFTESEDARLARAFDAALEPSRLVAAQVPAGARLVIIDFADPQVVKKFTYLVHPRRVFMPPRTDFRFSAAEARRILAEMPHGIDWCFDAGYTHLVDLRTLGAGDPSGIVSLEAIAR